MCDVLIICETLYWYVGKAIQLYIHNIILISPLMSTMHQPSIYHINVFEMKILERYDPHHLNDSDMWINKPK